MTTTRGAGTTGNFSDAEGNVHLGGFEFPPLRAVGWCHVLGCPSYAIATVEMGRFICDCDGRVLLGWRSDWRESVVPS